MKMIRSENYVNEKLLLYCSFENVATDASVELTKKNRKQCQISSSVMAMRILNLNHSIRLESDGMKEGSLVGSLWLSEQTVIYLNN